MRKEQIEELIQICEKLKIELSEEEVLSRLSNQYHVNISQATIVIAASYDIRVGEARQLILDSKIWVDELDSLKATTNEFDTIVNRKNEEYYK